MAQIGDQVDDPGYHLTHIPKGVAGEISKTQEMVWELQDGRSCRMVVSSARTTSGGRSSPGGPCGGCTAPGRPSRACPR
jgi:hypothetical protein